MYQYQSNHVDGAHTIRVTWDEQAMPARRPTRKGAWFRMKSNSFLDDVCFLQLATYHFSLCLPTALFS